MPVTHCALTPGLNHWTSSCGDTAPPFPASRSPAGLRPVSSTHLTKGETKRGRFPDPTWLERAFLWVCRASTGRPQGSEAHGGKIDGAAARSLEAVPAPRASVPS